MFIFLFTALAAGDAVVTSQYIGRGSDDLAGESASQRLLFSAVFSVVLMAAILVGNRVPGFALERETRFVTV